MNVSSERIVNINGVDYTLYNKTVGSDVGVYQSISEIIGFDHESHERVLYMRRYITSYEEGVLGNESEERVSTELIEDQLGVVHHVECREYDDPNYIAQVNDMVVNNAFDAINNALSCFGFYRN